MWKEKRRKKLRSTPFPEAWRQILAERFPLYLRLPEADRVELEGHIQVFVAEKHFDGCGGLEITDDIKICIAAQACLLLLHRETDYYPALRSVVVYPTAFFVKRTRHLGSGILEETDQQLLGEAWDHGAVVLAWDAVLKSTADPADGHNVVFHEFAHHLDFEDGVADGAPLLGNGDPSHIRRTKYATWARVLSAEFNRLRSEAPHGANTVLDAYGATDPVEFFAVATESFFERPGKMLERHPQLYQELKTFYRQDPAHWPAPAQLTPKPPAAAPPANDLPGASAQ